MFQNDRLSVTRIDGTTWETTEPLVYRGIEDVITVPAGTRTDFATVPKYLQWFIPRTGDYSRAAVVHDYLCSSLNDWGYATLDDKFSVISSHEVDGLFRRIMREEGVPAAQRWFMWVGVRWGALFNSHRRPGWLFSAPLVLLLSLLGLPVIILPVLAIWVSTILWWSYEVLASIPESYTTVKTCRYGSTE